MSLLERLKMAVLVALASVLVAIRKAFTVLHTLVAALVAVVHFGFSASSSVAGVLSHLDILKLVVVFLTYFGTGAAFVGHIGGDLSTLLVTLGSFLGTAAATVEHWRKGTKDEPTAPLTVPPTS